ncbi:UGMP family protein [Candidatus Woesearchaeota archaeon ex4484_78]|nr:MAG: UGMP family protein [Candidatus Woesearchaeota archaeon ex4484_78]
MLSLGIESTAHTFGVGVIDDSGKILVNEKSVFKNKKGMVPDEVAAHHKRVADKIINKVLEKVKDIGLISYSHGPGLPPCLLVGMNKAVSLSKKLSVPLVGVNHCIAHLSIGDLVCKTKDPVYLYVSGANTQIIAFTNKKFRIFGETLDIGLGNALDKFGRELNLGFPAGPVIERLAKNGKYVRLPYAVKGMDVSFSGLVTKAVRLVKEGKASVNDVCFSFQETAFSMLAEVAERAMAHCNKSELLLIGGVGANKRLCEILDIMCKERDAVFRSVPQDLAGDNGVMIAWQGLLQFKAGERLIKPDIFPYERTDAVVVSWR